MNKKPKLILISGKQQSGKTTMSNIIKINYSTIENPFLSVSISDQIKRISKELFSEITDSGDKDKIRDIYIQVGKKMREIDEKVWLKLFVKHLRQINETNPNMNIIVDDVRLKVEIDYIREQLSDIFDIYSLYIIRPDELRRKGERYSEEGEKDITETELFEIYKDDKLKNKYFDGIIINDTNDLKMYKYSIKTMLNYLKLI